MKWATEKHATIAFALTLALLVGDTALSYQKMLKLVEDDRQFARSHEVLAALHGTLSTMNEAQTGERGFLIAGETRFLVPYEEATACVHQEVERLKALTADNPGQQQRVASLEQVVTAELQVLSAVIQLRKDSGFEAVRQKVLKGGGRKMAEMRELVAEMTGAENDLLQRRAEESSASTRKTLLTLCLTGLLEFGCISLCYYLVRRNLRRRRRVEAALKEADRRKDEFLAMLGHELRNPLAPMLHALHLLRLQKGDQAAAGRAREALEWQLRHMTRLVDDLLDVSRISRGQIGLRKEPSDLSLLVNRAVEISHPLMAERRQVFTASLPAEPVWVEADPARLVQVLANLLNNAAKYTGNGGRIGLTAARNGGEVVVRIKDNGMGIAAELLPKVFDLFTQSERTLDRSQGGLGVGLTLARRLVEMHGGTIEASSDGPGKGSEFIVRLPALAGTPPPKEARRQGQRIPVSSGSRRILVVDDNASAAEMLALLLQMDGYEVRVAHEGLAALQMARTYQPDVVLLDIGLPGMDGYEVARRLREQPGSEDVLLIAMTGYGSDEDRRRSRNSGCDHHLLKPVAHQDLQALLAPDEAEALSGQPG